VIRIVGQKSSNDEWKFALERNELLLYGILDEQDKNLSPFVQHAFKANSSWDQVIEHLGETLYELLPLYVHPEFKNKVWGLVNGSVREGLRRRWERLCL